MPIADSKLVVCTIWSPNHSGTRTHVIDTISVHCMAGNLSIETCGQMFARREVEASSQYGVGCDGRIAQYVPEDFRSWCTSNRANDQRAITIEVANCAGGPDWPVTQAAFNALIDLLTDICQRHKIRRLLWRGDKSLIGQIDMQNMTVHRWFANKSCPGPYLFSRHSLLASSVNKRLEASEMTEADVRKIALDVMRQQNPVYQDIEDVPAYWRPTVQKLLDAGVLNGGTPATENATDVNLSMDTVKGIVLMEAYYNVIGGEKK